MWEHRHVSAARRKTRRYNRLDRDTCSRAPGGRPMRSIHEDRRRPTRHDDGRRARPDSPSLAERHRARDMCRSSRARGAPRPARARRQQPANGTNPRVALGRIYALPGEAPLPRSRLDPAPSLDVGAGRQRLTPTMRLTNGARQRLTPTPRHPPARYPVIDQRRLWDRCCGGAGRRLALIQSDTRAQRVDKFRTDLGPAELRAGPFAFRREAPRSRCSHREALFTSTLCRSVRHARTPPHSKITKE